MASDHGREGSSIILSRPSIFTSLADELTQQQELSPYLLARRLTREARPRPWAQPAKKQPADSDIRTGPAMSRPVAPRFSRLEGSSGVPSRLPLRISAPRVTQHGGSQAQSQPVLGTQSVALPTSSSRLTPLPHLLLPFQSSPSSSRSLFISPTPAVVVFASGFGLVLLPLLARHPFCG